LTAIEHHPTWRHFDAGQATPLAALTRSSRFHLRGAALAVAALLLVAVTPVPPASAAEASPAFAIAGHG
jgi:hypothetical protein